MRIDLYTKAALTVIALFLAAVVLKPLFRPETVAAQTGFSGVQLSGFGSNMWAIDSRTGDVWIYEVKSGAVELHRKLVKLGEPLNTK